jgi:hypothetical protein
MAYPLQIARHIINEYGQSDIFSDAFDNDVLRNFNWMRW